MLPRPTPTFLGYTLKRVAPVIDSLAGTPVIEICSVSNCISKRPEPPERWKRWLFNDSGWYNTPALAAADAEPGNSFSAFAYELFPLEFEGDAIRPTTAAALLNTDRSRLPASPELAYQFIGFDAVSVRRAIPATANTAPMMAGFDHSPLSCNAQAPHHPVNQCCLLDDWNCAVAAATTFAREEPEPGPYYILGVYRRIN